ncbi:MAG TPA: pitrilysin family protein [Gemmatimonadaceae bacterium]|nr:pitrilysin family protein [Gemmatimonadaceae bacterium]
MTRPYSSVSTMRTLSRIVALTLIVAEPAAAQKPSSPRASLDRRVIPTPGKNPELHVPTWTKVALSNGAQLVVLERHSLPLVSVQINFIGGANQYEAATKTGLAQFVANQMLEGTSHRTGEQIVNDLQMLGANFNPPPLISGESGRVTFTSTKDKLASTLAVVADIIENATFPQDALERYRARTLVTLTQARDRTGSINAVVFPKVVYGTDHPYGRSMSEESVKAITRDDLASLYKAYFQPGHAVVTVVGDVKPDEAKRVVEQAFADWKTGGSMPTFTYPSLPAPTPTTIYLVDKPGAAQSTFRIGEVGPPRGTPDYYAIRVMNEMLGVLFQSRLNRNIREEKSYSYGVGSGFSFGRGPGAFFAGGDIMTAKNDSALIEFMKELRDIRGARPPSDEEMAQAKASLVQSLPESFETLSGVNTNVSSIYQQGLPEDYYTQFVRAVGAVTKDDVVRVAQKYIDPEHLAIVIVGDREKIEGPLMATKIAPIVRLDVNGNPIADKVRP